MYHYKKIDENGETVALYDIYKESNTSGLIPLTQSEYDMEIDTVMEHAAAVEVYRDKILDYIAEVKSGELKLEDVPEQYREEVKGVLASDPEQAVVQTILMEVSEHDY